MATLESWPGYGEPIIQMKNRNPKLDSSQAELVSRDTYTGCKDKNGNKIFENDLIVHEDRNGKKPHLVMWSNEKGSFVGSYGDFGFQYNLSDYECTKIEIVDDINSRIDKSADRDWETTFFVRPHN